ncbi:MAG: serine hydrolase [Selenomonadaceae bacterium]|nr:serine hydrolase [Selenomonadaceae bacterium]
MYIPKKIIILVMLLLLSVSETAAAAISLPPAIPVRAAILLDITADEGDTKAKQLSPKELKRLKKEQEKQRRREEREQRRRSRGSSTVVRTDGTKAAAKQTGIDPASFFPPLPEAKVLYERNADVNRAPASLTKMMTALVAVKESSCRNLPLTRSINIRWDEAEETSYLVRGEIIPLYEAIAQMLIISDNGAAYAIARQIGSDGSGKDAQGGFYRRMNEYAGAMKLNGSYFADASGLPTPGHVSTARDMATIARYLLKDKDLKPIVGMKTRNITCIYPKRHRVFAENTNDLVYDYPGCYGIKTGYTNAAGFCLAAAAERDGHRLLTVVLGGDEPEDRFTAAARLLDYGFGLLKG